MNRFLTDKAIKKRWWEIPVGSFFTLLGFLTVKDAIKFFRVLGRADPESLVIVAAMAYVICVPLYNIIHWHILKHKAKVISQRLAGLNADQIQLATIDSVLGIRHVEKKIDDLISRGFLKGLTYDGMNLIIDMPETVQ